MKFQCFNSSIIQVFSVTTTPAGLTWILGPGNILFTERIPLSTPSAKTHWQWLHTVLVELGVQTWHALQKTVTLWILFTLKHYTFTWHSV